MCSVPGVFRLLLAWLSWSAHTVQGERAGFEQLMVAHQPGVAAEVVLSCCHGAQIWSSQVQPQPEAVCLDK